MHNHNPRRVVYAEAEEGLPMYFLQCSPPMPKSIVRNRPNINAAFVHLNAFVEAVPTSRYNLYPSSRHPLAK